MNQYCDLHTHSKFSDGSDTPAQLVDKALALGLSAVALTDHNTVDGLPDFLAAAAGKDILAIAGTEFSVDLNGIELHLLGLFIAPRHFPAVRAFTADFLRRKEQSNRELCQALNRAGYSLDYEAIRAQSPNGNVNRSAFATALVNRKYFACKADAFTSVLAKNGGYYREPLRPTVWETLDFLTGIGAVPVLAHPFLTLTEQALREFLPRAKAQGLAGMETAYSTYDEQTTALAAGIAAEFGLLQSGGSDYHGSEKRGIDLGTGKGSLRVPAGWAIDLMNTAR